MREQVGQLGFLAALSGFRSLVADVLWIRAHVAWERTEWGRMVLLFNNVTALQPRVTMFWEMAAWHMAYNAGVAARNDPKLPREALRIKAERQYWDIGRDFLQRGIRNNPDRYVLYDRLGTLLRDKYKDHAGAAEAFARVATFEDAPKYAKRFAAYELSYCPGKEADAYALLLSYYKMGRQEQLPTLLSRLQYLQEKLNVPAGERVYIPQGKHQ